MKKSISNDSLVFAKHVLALNDRGSHTIPAKGLYPHQWLWDSCFTAIGLRHLNPHRARRELINLTKGQWRNGMLPHMLLQPEGWRSLRLWKSHKAKYASRHVGTSGITQPPMLAEAALQVANMLSTKEKKAFIADILQPLIKYHQWLYRERDPHNEGLVLVVHPWETGMDNSPVLMQRIHRNKQPLWITIAQITKLSVIISLLRRDRRWVLDNQRASTVDMLSLYSLQRQLRRRRYDIHSILKHAAFAVEDLAYNCMLIRANSCLTELAKTIGQHLPKELQAQMKKTPHALELLWHEQDEQYYSRDHFSRNLIRQSSISTLLPLYAGSVSKKRAAQLVGALRDSHSFSANFPIPTVPLNSRAFKSQIYWQGPTWINMNWMIIRGLECYGYVEEAEVLRNRTLQLVDLSGMREYFDPVTGEGLGAENFSWTAALIIDLIEQ